MNIEPNQSANIAGYVLKKMPDVIKDKHALKHLISQGENLYLEFKRRITHPEKVMKEVVAFANTIGGWLLLGVSDNGQMVGVDPDAEIFVFQKAVDTLINPKVDYNLSIIDIGQELAVIAIYIPKAADRPIALLTSDIEEPQKVYFRVDSSSIQASKELREIIKAEVHQKALRIELAQKEIAILAYIEKNNAITVKQVATLFGINKKIASRTIVLMAINKIIQIVPQEGEDTFILY